MNEPVHRPEVVDDIQNAIAYYAIAGMVTCGVIFLFGGMFSPFFIPWVFTSTANLPKEEKSTTRIAFLIGIAAYFVISWTVFILLHIYSYGGMLNR